MLVRGPARGGQRPVDDVALVGIYRSRNARLSATSSDRPAALDSGLVGPGRGRRGPSMSRPSGPQRREARCSRSSARSRVEWTGSSSATTMSPRAVGSASPRALGTGLISRSRRAESELDYEITGLAPSVRGRRRSWRSGRCSSWGPAVADRSFPSQSGMGWGSSSSGTSSSSGCAPGSWMRACVAGELGEGYDHRAQHRTRGAGQRGSTVVGRPAHLGTWRPWQERPGRAAYDGRLMKLG